MYLPGVNTPTWGIGVHEHKKHCVWTTKSMIGTIQMSMRGENKVFVVYISVNIMTLQGTASDIEPLAISHSALTGWEYYRFLIKEMEHDANSVSGRTASSGSVISKWPTDDYCRKNRTWPLEINRPIFEWRAWVKLRNAAANGARIQVEIRNGADKSKPRRLGCFSRFASFWQKSHDMSITVFWGMMPCGLVSVCGDSSKKSAALLRIKIICVYFKNAERGLLGNVGTCLPDHTARSTNTLIVLDIAYKLNVKMYYY